MAIALTLEKNQKKFKPLPRSSWRGCSYNKISIKTWGILVAFPAVTFGAILP